MEAMRFRAFLKRWWTPAANSDEAIRRYRAIALTEAAIAAAMLALFLSTPLWVAENVVSEFSNWFLTAAVVFAALAAGSLFSTMLIKRDPP
jgi:hypothetical protein